MTRISGEPGSPVDETLEKRWSALDVIGRAILLKDLGVDGRNEEFLGGKTMEEIIQSSQGDLPCEVRSRLLMAVTPGGFSKEEYESVKKGPERGD